MTCETCGAVWCRARNLCSRDGCERGERAMWGRGVGAADFWASRINGRWVTQSNAGVRQPWVLGEVRSGEIRNPFAEYNASALSAWQEEMFRLYTENAAASDVAAAQVPVMVEVPTLVQHNDECRACFEVPCTSFEGEGE